MCHWLPLEGMSAPCGTLMRPTVAGSRGDAMSRNAEFIDCVVCLRWLLRPAQQPLPVVAPRRPPPLSPEEMAKRAPRPPEELVGALHDPIHPARRDVDA